MKPLAHKPGAHRVPSRPDTIYSRVANIDTTLMDILMTAFGDVRRTTVKAWMKYGQVMAGSEIVTAFNHPIPAGTEVKVNISRPWQTLSHPRLKIVYEDDDIIIVNKGYGLLSVATDNKKQLTAYSILRDYVKRVNPANKIFIVHRLDQHTSGLMLFAKSIQAKDAMQHNWNNMVLDRRYAAIVEGRLEQDSGTIDTFLAENTRHLMYVADEKAPDAKRAVTRWTAVRSRSGYTLMDINLDTGRKNQIRAHMQHIGHPIAGDRRYGAKTSPAHRLCLHARTLRFIHPITRQDMNFSLPLPASFNKIV
ncbi:MAG: RluA family pseudouridine synthase [Muribaculaceae bacterium]|nr:RluA family pseudouridine synthase [Muribaculaceae bacterium]